MSTLATTDLKVEELARDAYWDLGRSDQKV